MEKDVLEKIGRILPQRYARKIQKFLDLSGKDYLVESFVGTFIVFGFLGSFLFLLFVSLSKDLTDFSLSIIVPILSIFSKQLASNKAVLFFSTWILGLIISFASEFMIVYSYILMEIEARKKAIDNILPDFLTLVSANVRAGMTIDRAMWYAAKPEFGIFAKEVQFAIKKAMSGEPFNKSLDYLVNRFNSKLFRRTVLLIKQSLASGGETAKVLEQTADEARSTQLLSKEIASSLTLYIIFILFATVIGTPFLFAVSGKLIGILDKVFTDLPISNFSNTQASTLLPIGQGNNIGTLPISLKDFNLFSFAMIFLTSFLSSLIIGAIQTGNKINGLRFAPMIFIFSIIVYYLVTFVLSMFFSNMFV